MSQNHARARLVAACVAFLMAMAVAVTGGFRSAIGSVPLSLRRPSILATLAWLLLSIDSLRDPHERPTSSVLNWVGRHTRALALVVSLATLVGASLSGAFVAAGADPYGYVSQALLWAQGNPAQFQTRLALDAPWPNAEWSFAPLGYRPSPIRGLIVPTYPIGLPLEMAALERIVGSGGLWAVVPVAGALFVWATYRLGRRVCSSKDTAVIAALAAACSPAFLFQLMQPMSDVPAAAFWCLAIVAALDEGKAAAAGSGLYCSLAILTRPNLVPLVLPLAAWTYWASPHHRRLRLLLFGCALVPGIALTAAANAVFFGSPLRSGYGPLEHLYSWSHAKPNLINYPSALYETESAVAFLGFALLIRAVSTADGRESRLLTHARLGAVFVLAVFMCYVFYLPFEHWTNLRFILPAFPLLLVLGVEAARLMARRLPWRIERTVVLWILVVLPLAGISFALHGDAFRLRALFGDRYPLAARAIAERTPETAAILSVLQSGSLRHYGQRLTIRYDLLDPDWLERAADYCRANGLTMFVALESTESAPFTTRFGRANAAQFLTTPQIVDPMGRVTLYGR